MFFQYQFTHLRVDLTDANMGGARADFAEFGPKSQIVQCVNMSPIFLHFKRIRMKYEPGYCISRMISLSDGQLVTERDFYKRNFRMNTATTWIFYFMCAFFRPKRI